MRRFGALLVALGLIGFLAGSLAVRDPAPAEPAPVASTTTLTVGSLTTDGAIMWTDGALEPSARVVGELVVWTIISFARTPSSRVEARA